MTADLKQIWQSQGGGGEATPIEELRRRARRFHARIQRRNLIEYVAAILVVCSFGYVAYFADSLLVRLGCALIMLAAFYVVFQLHQRASARAPTPDAGAETYVSFHRAELQRQCAALESVWRWYLAPFVPGFIVFEFGVAAVKPAIMWIPAALTVALMVGVFYGIWLINQFAARKLRCEIEALDALQSDQSSEYQ
jgi:uncharacterized membrane protein YfcA